MFGIDNTLLDQIDFNMAIQRVKSDIKSDFIFAPHIIPVLPMNIMMTIWNTQNEKVMAAIIA
jgi:hypothetical protein